jgi:hypothetical protein
MNVMNIVNVKVDAHRLPWMARRRLVSLRESSIGMKALRHNEKRTLDRSAWSVPLGMSRHGADHGERFLRHCSR